MELGSFAAFLAAAISLVVAIFSIRQSSTARRETRAYKDPVFVLECVPMVLDQGGSPVDQPQLVTFKLINQGDAFATDVRGHAEFDPFGLHVHKMRWPFVERSGGHVLWFTQVGVTPSSAGILSQVALTEGAGMCVIEFKSQAGHECTQRIPLPDVQSFVTIRDDQVH